MHGCEEAEFWVPRWHDALQMVIVKVIMMVGDVVRGFAVLMVHLLGDKTYVVVHLELEELWLVRGYADESRLWVTKMADEVVVVLLLHTVEVTVMAIECKLLSWIVETIKFLS